MKDVVFSNHATTCKVEYYLQIQQKLIKYITKKWDWKFDQLLTMTS